MHESQRPTLMSRALVAFFIFLALALALLIWEHRAHSLGLLPFVVFALCPFLHLFMHGRHRHGGSGREVDADIAAGTVRPHRG